METLVLYFRSCNTAVVVVGLELVMLLLEELLKIPMVGFYIFYVILVFYYFEGPKLA